MMSSMSRRSHPRTDTMILARRAISYELSREGLAQCPETPQRLFGNAGVASGI
jgi:hypothetical protein